MRWLTRSLLGRLTSIVIVGILGSQLAGAVIHFSDRENKLGYAVRQEIAQRIVAVYRAIDGQNLEESRRLAKLLSTPRHQLSIETAAPQSAVAPAQLSVLSKSLGDLLGPGVDIRSLNGPSFSPFNFDIYIRLSSGDWLSVSGRGPKESAGSPLQLLASLGLMLLVVIGLVYFAARSTVRPLGELERAARSLSKDLNSPQLRENGPSEVREVARAFNAMQAQIRDGIEDRERFLAAVSHDLKTPLTRLRLRAEMLSDKELREHFLKDFYDMQQLLDSALEYLQGNLADEAVQPIDLIALTESLVDDYHDIGQVVLKAPDTLRFWGRPMALKRALSNLIENAIKYGESVEIDLVARPDGIEIAVMDRGPGLPDDELENVLKPFYRVEGSRSRDTGGTGLGLAIVRQVALNHGGDLCLSNRADGGLKVVLYLPSSAGNTGEPEFCVNRILR